MLNVRQILVSTTPGLIGLAFLGVGLAGCGQRGPLHLPQEPAAAQRAPLHEVLTPSLPTRDGAPPPAAPASGAQP